MKRLLFTLLFFLFAARAAQATTWYVHQSGSHGANCTDYQTITTPASTIGAAMTCAIAAGGPNTVEINDSSATVYSETVSSWPVVTSGGRFTLKATNAGVVTIRPAGDSKILEGTASHIQIGPNLILDGVNGSTYASGRGIMWDTGDDLLIVNNEVKNTKSMGIRIGTTTNLVIRGNSIHNNGSPVGSPGGFSNQTHGIYCETAGALIENNTIHDTAYFGIQCYTDIPVDVTNNTIRYNTIYNWGRADGGGAGALLMQSGGKIYSNIFYTTDRLSGGAIACGSSTNCSVLNNTIYNVAAQGAYVVGATGAVVRNNLILDTTTPVDQSGCAGCTVSSNVTSGTATTYWVSPSTGDFHLNNNATTQANAINQGADVATLIGCTAGVTCTDISTTTIRPQGAGWDIGAYEFVSGSLPVLAIKGISPAAASSCDPAFSACTVTGSANNVITLSGISTQSGGTVTWACIDSPTPRCGNGTTTGTVANWVTTNITLKAGINLIKITGTDGTGNVGTTQITVTFVPTFPGNTAVLLLGFENGSGTSATDSSGNGNTGTLTNGVTWTTSGRFGKAVSLDGINDYVNVLDANSLHMTQSWTISAYVQPVTSFTTFKAVVHKNSTPTDPQASGYELYGSIAATGGCTAGGIGAFSNVNGASGPYNTVCTSNPLQTNQWTHLAATYDNASAQLKLYRNGVLISTTTASGYIEPSTGSLQIGASEFGEYFQGLIDEVRIYNFALPLSAGSNTVPGAACTSTNWLQNTDVNFASIIGNMNCPIINLSPPSQFKVSSGATQLKLGSSATAAKIGANP